MSILERFHPAVATWFTEKLSVPTEAQAQGWAEILAQRDGGVVRNDYPLETLSAFLLLVYDGLVAQLATGMPVQHLDGVLDLVEQAVRETPTNDSRS